MSVRMRAVLLASAALMTLLLLAAPAFATGDQYEPDNTLGTAKPISVSVDVTGTALQMHTFDTNHDVDFVKMSATKGTTYIINVFGTDKTNTKRWMKVTIYRYSKKKWYQVGTEDFSEGSTGASDFTFKAIATTTYAIRIRPYTAHGAGTTYGVRIIPSAYPAVKPDAYEPGDNALAGSTVLAPQPFTPTSMTNSGIYAYSIYGACQLHSILPASDGDWYSITMPAGHAYYIEYSMGDWTSHTVKVDFYDSSGTGFGQTHVLTGEYVSLYWSQMPTTSTYYFHVYGNGKDKFWYRTGLFHTQ